VTQNPLKHCPENPQLSCSNMEVIILGAGAIGSLYGAKLSQRNSVTLIGKKEHVDTINTNGLQVTGYENKKYALRAATEIKTIKSKTLIILTTKIYDSGSAIKKILDKIRKDTVILCLQNGYGSEEIVKKIIHNKCIVLRGITAVGTSFLEPGKIKMNNVGYTSIENSVASKELAENFSSCGLKAFVAKNIKEEIWKKLILNCMLNPLTTILKIKNSEAVQPLLISLVTKIAQECVAVAKKDGVDFDKRIIDETIERLKKSDNLSSMYQDIMKGKRTEIDFLNGAVVELGKKYGVDCPINESLVVMIKYLESGK